MTKLRFGITGSGMIAEVITKAIQASESAAVTAVCSRLEENAKAFAKAHNIDHPFASWNEMVRSGEIDAVYIACPTIFEEEIALAAAEAKKHLLADKPFLSAASVEKMIQAAKSNGVLFMDATHFSHHPRTHHIKENMLSAIGEPQTIVSSFFFPFDDTSNIRFNPEKEPMTVVGDMAWYCMRAVTEYMPKAETVKTVSGFAQKLEGTHAFIRGSGFIEFNDGLTTTFNYGYNIGACLMDLDIHGHTGSLYLDDYVLDWQSSFPFDNPNHQVGFTKKSEMNKPDDCPYIYIPNQIPQHQRMIDRFAELAQNPSSPEAQVCMAIALKTQQFLDAVWESVK